MRSLAQLQRKLIMSRTTDIRQPEMLRDVRMAGLAKLQCGIT
jgi:hypothetical protein